VLGQRRHGLQFVSATAKSTWNIARLALHELCRLQFFVIEAGHLFEEVGIL